MGMPKSLSVSGCASAGEARSKTMIAEDAQRFMVCSDQGFG